MQLHVTEGKKEALGNSHSNYLRIWWPKTVASNTF